MKDIRDVIVDALSDLAVVYLQGSYPQDETLPDEIITYQLPTSENRGSYDNRRFATSDDVEICYYTKDIDQISDVPESITERLQSAGLKPTGNFMDLPFEPDTGHYGAYNTFKNFRRK